MRVALAMVVRDEADVVEHHLRFHLAVGVDVVLVTDHGSTDGTSEILERYAGDGAVRVIREDAKHIRQGEWMTRMARLAATELGADWVLCSDGDEFWWPRGGSIGEVLRGVPARYGTVHALSQPFVPVRDDGRPFPERMTVRLSPSAPLNDPTTPFRPVSKVAHRAHAGARVSNGNHEVHGVPGAVLRGWAPLEILHFPLRSPAQVVHKYRKTWEGWERNPRGDIARARSLAGDARAEEMHRRLVVDDEALDRGLAGGVLVRDTRLRDVLRGLDGGDVPWREAVNHRHPLEASVLAEAELVRIERRVEALGGRASAVGGRRSRPDGGIRLPGT